MECFLKIMLSVTVATVQLRQSSLSQLARFVPFGGTFAVDTELLSLDNLLRFMVLWKYAAIVTLSAIARRKYLKICIVIALFRR